MENFSVCLFIIHIHYNIYLSILQRLAERVSTFKKLSFNDVDKQKWRKVLITDMISSDDSETDDGNAVFSIKNLRWRSEKVSRFFSKLDQANQARKSEQAARQTKPRLHLGAVSSRAPPTSDRVPAWAFGPQE